MVYILAINAPDFRELKRLNLSEKSSGYFITFDWLYIHCATICVSYMSVYICAQRLRLGFVSLVLNNLYCAMSGKQKVAVIGAGPSGLCALRHLAMDPDNFIPVAFEKNRKVGGLWNYSDFTDVDEYGLPCYASIYKQLRIVLPTAVMCFPDKMFSSDGLPSFTHHSEVKKYLDNYAATYDLNKYCKFQTLVVNVKPCVTSDGVTWLVTSRDLKTDKITTDKFDRVCICNGREGKAHVPKFAGSEKFKGTIVHTKNHRDHEVYRGKTVLVVGASYSAQDIIFEVGTVTPKLYVSHRLKGPLPFPVPDNVEEVPEIKEVLPNGVLLTNGECREVDDIILATGYEFNLPFLDPSVGLQVKDERIQPLYNQMIHIEFPTLNFIGLITGVLRFQVSYAQAHYACALARGDIKLPSKVEMYREVEEDYQSRVVNRGLHPKFAHDLFGLLMTAYVETLAKATNVRWITPGVIKLFDQYCDALTYEYGTLKQRTYKLISDDDFEQFL